MSSSRLCGENAAKILKEGTADHVAYCHIQCAEEGNCNCSAIVFISRAMMAILSETAVNWLTAYCTSSFVVASLGSTQQ